jgi:hypothetical protein
MVGEVCVVVVTGDRHRDHVCVLVCVAFEVVGRSIEPPDHRGDGVGMCGDAVVWSEALPSRNIVGRHYGSGGHGDTLPLVQPSATMPGWRVKDAATRSPIASAGA